MATGLPVAATRVGGVPDAVVDGVTGLLAPPRDPAALAAALLRLQRRDAECALLGARGRHHVEERFDVRRMVTAYEGLYVEHRQSPVVQAARLHERICSPNMQANRLLR